MGDTLSNLVTHLFTAVLGVVIGALIAHSCGDRPRDTHTHDVEYIKGDSFPYVVFKGSPIERTIVYRDSIHFDTIKLRDTAAMIRDYFAMVKYHDTLKNDTSALIVLDEIISENRIQHREVLFQNKRPIAIINKRTSGFVAGGGIYQRGYDAAIGYRFKGNQLMAGYGWNGFGVRYYREF